MRTAAVVLFGFFCLQIVAGKDSSLDEVWSQFKTRFGKVYETAQEELKRREIFEQNVRLISDHNLGHDNGANSHRLGLNQFADMTNEEYRKQMLHPMTPKVQKGRKTLGKIKYPQSIDYRALGDVTPVQDQGQCGSAVVFATVGSVESNNAVVNGKLVPLSIQQVADCTDQGCNGGYITDVFDYIIKAGGIESAADYPTGNSGDCKFDASKVAAKLDNYEQVLPNDEATLTEWVGTKGPIVVFIDASQMSFMTYQSGIYEDTQCNMNNVDHSMLIVGYGTENGKDFWILKNSWGASWGEQGYMRMARNANNMCGVASFAFYPHVHKN